MARTKIFVLAALLVTAACGKNGGITSPPPPPPPPVATVTIKGFLSPTITFAIRGDTSSRMQQVYLCASPNASLEMEFVGNDVAQVLGSQISVPDQLITDNLCKGTEQGYRVTRMVKALRAGTGTIEVVPKQALSTKREFTVKVETL